MFGNLGKRIKALEQNIAQAERDRKLEARWKRELHEALTAQQRVDHSRPVPRDGLDYLEGPSAGAVRAAGYTFVCRYASNLSELEAEDLTHAGLEIVLVSESGASRALQGSRAGSIDAKQAIRQGQAVGLPHDAPVYLTVDFDAQPDQLAAVRSYFAGASDAIGWNRTGAYGGIHTIQSLHAINACRYYWQTFAWSGGQWAQHAQLRQVAIERNLAGHRVDIDRAVAADFGQWRVGG